MINKFRTRYPQGGLISELLNIDHGKYIVKVSIHVEGITLATGLAAADTVEAAEDQARIRALALLDLEPLTATAEDKNNFVPSSLPSKNGEQKTAEGGQPSGFGSSARAGTAKTPTASPQAPTGLMKGGNSSAHSPSPFQGGVPVTKIEDEPRTVAKSSQSSQPTLINVSPVSESSEPLLDTAEENVPFVFESEASEYPLFGSPENESEDEPVAVESPLIPEPEPIMPVSPKPSKTYTPPISNEPTDFSEVIAKSNVEMKRLGWTNEQGRDYLVSTYGKRSRQLLDDHELIEFLHYLESQPTP